MKISSNIWKFYLYRIFSSLELTVPIFVLFLLENGLSMTQILFLEAIYTVCILVFSVPAGAFADKYGRKLILTISVAFLILASFIFYLGHSFYTFLIAELIWGLASAAFHGPDKAFVFDTLAELKKESEYLKFEGRIQFINRAFFGVASLIGGFLAVYGLRNVFLYGIIPWLIAIFVAFFFVETRIHRTQEPYFRQINESVRFSASHPQIRFLVLFYAITSGVTFFSFIIMPALLESIGLDVKHIGIAFFVFFIAAALGSLASKRIDSFVGEERSLYWVVILLGLTWLVIASTKIAIIVVIAFVLNSIVNGYFDPVYSSYLNKHIPSSKRATINSFDTMVLNLFTAVFAPFFGYISDTVSMQFAFFCMFLVMMLNIIVLFIGYKVKEVLK